MPTSRKSTSGAGRPKGRRWTHTLDVIGLRFRWKRDGRRALADMIAKRGSISGVKLVREPDNRADENAIMVMLPDRILNGAQLGYVRADSAKLLAPKLDSGSLAVANVVLESLDADDDWNTGEMVVTFIDIAKPRKRRTISK